LPVVPYALSRAFASRYQPLIAAQGSSVPVVVLLGGGQVNIAGRDRTPLPLLSASSAHRVLEAVRVYRLLGATWLISSGGSRRLDQPPNAEAMRSALVQLGVPPQRILMEARSTTTHEQAVL